MKNLALYLGMATVLVASCSNQEKDFQAPPQEDVIYYASFELPAIEGTRVYANEDLLLRWTSDDRVSIFGKNTYNQEYKFLGETGDNSGGFGKVDGAEYMTGNHISHTVSVYPYQESTKITESEILTVTLPEEQSYAKNTFGLGANTMVSVSSDNVLQYKNVGGYLLLKLYGEGVSVESITLRGNNGEKLAGKATITMPLNGTPTAAMGDDATTELTLTCPIPVALGATAEESTQFWFVIPPVTFEKGFTVSVSESTGGVFEKSTSKSITILRNNLSKMSCTKVDEVILVGNIEFADSRVKEKLVAAFDTNGDEELSYEEAAAVTSIDGVFGASKVYRSFDEFQFFTGVKSIPDSMFENWNLLTSIVLPNSIENIGSWAFMGCVKLSQVTLSENLITISQSSFADCKSLTSIAIPDKVKKIHSSAFYNCVSLASPITLPKGLTLLGGNAFYNCELLPHITFAGDTIDTIGEGAFHNCSSLDSMIIPEGIEIIYYDLFKGCASLSSVSIPNSVRDIYAGAFAGCVSLTSMIIPDNVQYIGLDARGGYSNQFAESNKDKGVFENCTSLVNVYLGHNLQYIGHRTFCNCTSLETMTLPDWIEEIGALSFYGCTSLCSITIPDSVSSIGQYCFAECYSLKEIELPDSITEIRRGAFMNCTALKEIVIPDSVRIIDSQSETTSGKGHAGVFYGCSSLSSALIGTNVETIGAWCFYDCHQMGEIVFKSVTPPKGGDSMLGNTNNCPIYVPASSVDEYKSAQYWSKYADRIYAIGTPMPVDLGLPSGLKWASFNLGASKPEEYGDYYAWGETETKDDYSWATYKWGMGDWNTMTKYCSDSSYGYNGFTDGKTVLDPEDDAAHVNLGGKWRMPTDAEWTELRERCSWATTTQNNIKGCLVTGTNGNRIFLPAAGGWFETGFNFLGTKGYYWSSSLDDRLVRLVAFDSYDVYRSCVDRSPGLSVRPVYAE